MVVIIVSFSEIGSNKNIIISPVDYYFMGSCTVCGTHTEVTCDDCSQYVCSKHSTTNSHHCKDADIPNQELSNNVEVNFENSVGSVNIGGATEQNDSPTDSNSLEDLVELKNKITSNSTDSHNQVTLTKALEQSSELKADATDETISRTQLIDEIDRLLVLIGKLDNVSGDQLETIETIQRVSEQGQSASLTAEEREKIRIAVAKLEDELHLLLNN